MAIFRGHYSAYPSLIETLISEKEEIGGSQEDMFLLISLSNGWFWVAVVSRPLCAPVESNISCGYCKALMGMGTFHYLLSFFCLTSNFMHNWCPKIAPASKLFIHKGSASAWVFWGSGIDVAINKSTYTQFTCREFFHLPRGKQLENGSSSGKWFLKCPVLSHLFVFQGFEWDALLTNFLYYLQV